MTFIDIEQFIKRNIIRVHFFFTTNFFIDELHQDFFAQELFVSIKLLKS